MLKNNGIMMRWNQHLKRDETFTLNLSFGTSLEQLLYQRPKYV